MPPFFGNRKDHNMYLFDKDPHATSINLKRHCYGEFSGASVQANTAMEDRSQVEVGSRNVLFLGLYDGHGGFEASEFVSEHLFNNVLTLSVLSNTVSGILRNAIKVTEDDFLSHVNAGHEKNQNLGKTGSCCLAGIIWKGILHVANLGDSRAVIGTMVNNEIHAEQLTRDHNCNDEAIRKELQEKYPDDPNIVMYERGVWRVKGIITVSRSIGDTYLKRPEFRIRESYKVPEPFKRGVISADPEIHSRPLTRNDKFLIFASSGLWELVSNDQAVEIVQNHSRKGIAKKLLSTALVEAAKRKNVTCRSMIQAGTGNSDTSRKSFHDDISVIVVFLDKKSFLRKPLHNLSYKSMSHRPTPSAFAQSGLVQKTTNGLWRMKKTIRFRSTQKSPQTP